MRRPARTTALALALPLAVGGLTPLAASAQEEEPPYEVVVEGLNNPRGLSFTTTDPANLLVAEAGTGGAPDSGSPSESSNCIPAEPEGFRCFDTTGSITQVDALDTLTGDAPATVGEEGGPAQRVVTDQPSLAFPDNPETDTDETGTFAIGPSDVIAAGAAPDALYFTVGLEAPVAERQSLVDAGNAEAAELATLQEGDTSTLEGETGSTRLADLGAFAQNENPDEQENPESNPHSLVEAEPERTLVVDAGGNAVLDVDTSGEAAATETAAVLDAVPMRTPPFLPGAPGLTSAEPVPTGIVDTPLNGYRLGQLTGFPFQAGQAGVFTLEETEAGHELSLDARGFTNVIDLAVGPDNNLYVLEISHDGLAGGGFPDDGALYRVSEEPDGNTTRELVLTGLTAPGGIAFGPDGNAWISHNSIYPGERSGDAPTGEVIRFDAANAEPLLSVADDAGETDEDEAVEIDVLDNDTAGDGSELSMGRTFGADGATEAGSLRFQPMAHFDGPTSATYEACTGDGSVCGFGETSLDVTETAVDRLDGATRIGTAVEVSRSKFPHGADTVVIAREDKYPDALAGGPLAAELGAPILLTPSDSLDDETAGEIDRLGASEAVILGGSEAISQDVENAITSDTSVTSTQREGGTDRFETAALILEELESRLGEPITDVFVAEGRDPDPRRGFPDPMAVSGLASHLRQPILLVETDEVSDFTADALAGRDAARIVGGTVAVSEEVENEVDGIVGSVSRLAGADRYETSFVVAGQAVSDGLDPKLLWLAQGENWPDALVAGPSVARDGGVLLLVHPDDLDDSPRTRSFIDTHEPLDDLDLLGGTDAISAAVADQLAAERSGGS